MELRHLRTFVAVAEELHFGAAAARLYLSPPAVTEHVQAIEREVGVSLFVRSRSIQLTDAGAVLLSHARETLAHADAAIVALRRFRAGEAGTLRVGILSNGAGRLTPEIVREFMITHPDVRVTLQRLNLVEYASALNEHRVDVAFVRPAPDDGRLCSLTLSKEGRVVVLPERHPMAEAPELAVEEVLDEIFVGTAEGVPDCFTDYLYLEALRGGISPQRSDIACSDVNEVLAAVAAGRGIASAVESFRGYENWPGVAYVRLRGVEPGVNSLVTRIDEPSPVVAEFVATAQAMLANANEDPTTTAVMSP